MKRALALLALAGAVSGANQVATPVSGGRMEELRVQNGYWIHAKSEKELERMADTIGVSPHNHNSLFSQQRVHSCTPPPPCPL